MNFKSIFLILIFALFLNNSFAQSSGGIVKGSVTDSISGLPIENAAVFIPFTTIGTTTNANGEFVLDGLPYGNNNLMIRHVAYRAKSVKIDIKKDQTLEINTALSENRLAIDEIVKEASVADRQQGLMLFNKHFLGKNCKLKNPEDLNFYFDKDILVALASKPLQIQNSFLGYEITYYLDHYQLYQVDIPDDAEGREEQRKDYNSFERLKAGWTEPINTASIRYYQSFSGSAVYNDLAIDRPIRRMNWVLNRKSEFSGSLKHFLIALYEGTLNESPYKIRKCCDKSETRDQITDSIPYWDYDMQQPAYLYYAKDLEFNLDKNYISPGPAPWDKTLLFNGSLLIFYDKYNTIDLSDDRVVEITIHKGFLDFNSDGSYRAPEGSRIWIYHDSGIRLDVLLPNDYLPLD